MLTSTTLGYLPAAILAATILTTLFACSEQPNATPPATSAPAGTAAAQSPAPANRDPVAFGFTEITMKAIDGKDVSLSKYRDKVVLAVNVASRCGHTKQYTGLQQLHERYADKGLAVVGFPCNQFGGQEPGTEEQIMEFCSTKYNVTFDLFAKVDVNGDKACDLYRHLTSTEPAIADQGPVKWNFEKFLISREGKVIARFRSKVQPNDSALIAAIEAALAAEKI